MDIDEYFRSIEGLAKQIAQDGIAPQDFVEHPKEHADLVSDCVTFKETLLTAQEENELSGYLPLGFFTGNTRRQRLASFAFCFDLQHAADLLDVKRQCDPYRIDQPLFKGEPELFKSVRQSAGGEARQKELIALQSIQSVSGSEVYRVGKGYGKLCRFLSPGIVNWSHTNFPNSETFVRLDPYQYYSEKPVQLLTEATLVPANPRWLGDFSLRKGMKDFASYQLLERRPAEAPAEFWDYRIRHLRRLEVHVARRKDD